jgi:trimethylamine---corrinoid protein Co-methyltransferase
VRIPRGLVEDCLATVPADFLFHARNPENTIRLGGDAMAFGTVSSAPNCSDADGGRRSGTLADYRNFLKLGQVFNCIHFIGGYPVEPIDVHPSIRHLVAIRDMARLTDKPFQGYSLGPERINDAIEIARIARGVSRGAARAGTVDELDRQHQLAAEARHADAAGHHGPVGEEPDRLRHPVHAGRRHGAGDHRGRPGGAECRGAGRPGDDAGGAAGAPFIYGCFTSNVDMKSGAPAFGTPEYMKACIIGGQLARRYNVPYRTSNTCAANAVDAQAAYESVFSLWGVTMGGGNMVLHAAGWMEGGLVASYEKFVLDCDLLQMVTEFMQPLEINEDTLGLDAIREVGPGGHFFGAAHTLARYTDAFYAPMISDWRNHQQWAADGGPRAWQRANALWKQALAEYEPPPIDPAVAEELDAFVARRTEEGGAPTDF